jgi:hypothetical protein
LNHYKKILDGIDANLFAILNEEDGGIFRISIQVKRIPVSLHLYGNNDEGKGYLYLSARTSSWEFDGDRTDLHDIFSTILSLYLRIHHESKYSCSLWNVENPILGELPGEIYGRKISVEQPFGKSIDLNDLESILNFINRFKEASIFLVKATSYACRNKNSFLYEKELNRHEIVFKDLSKKLGEEAGIIKRINPPITYLRTLERDLSLIYSPTVASEVKSLFDQSLFSEITGERGDLFLSENIRNLVNTEERKQIKDVFRLLGEFKNIAFIPLENYLVGVCDNYLVTIASDSGKWGAESEIERIRERRLKEDELLFGLPSIQWSSSIDDNEFETLTLDLIERENDVFWVRKVGATRDRDRGKDLVSEWLTQPLPGEEIPEDQLPIRKSTVLIQCKSSSQPINKSKVNDIRDTVEDHDADGYMLVTNSYLTSALTDHLLNMRKKNKIWTDWWTKAELEKRILKNPDIHGKYPSVFTVCS